MVNLEVVIFNKYKPFDKLAMLIKEFFSVIISVCNNLPFISKIVKVASVESFNLKYVVR